MLEQSCDRCGKNERDAHCKTLSLSLRLFECEPVTAEHKIGNFIENAAPSVSCPNNVIPWTLGNLVALCARYIEFRACCSSQSIISKSHFHKNNKNTHKPSHCRHRTHEHLKLRSGGAKLEEFSFNLLCVFLMWCECDHIYFLHIAMNVIHNNNFYEREKEISLTLPNYKLHLFPLAARLSRSRWCVSPCPLSIKLGIPHAGMAAL